MLVGRKNPYLLGFFYFPLKFSENKEKCREIKQNSIK